MKSTPVRQHLPPRGCRERLHPKETRGSQGQRHARGRIARVGAEPPVPEDEGAGNRAEGVKSHSSSPALLSSYSPQLTISARHFIAPRPDNGKREDSASRRRILRSLPARRRLIGGGSS